MPAERDPDEQAFAAIVNKALAGEARVDPFTKVDEAGTKTYGLVFSSGSKRHTITSDAPFHYDAPDDVIARVRQWTRGARAELYSTDAKYAE